ncbi:MAG: YlbF family regulator [Lactococcus plantarum]|nr:YlbF family regulator [Lactococcus plantarum]MDN6084601.1 YlbF family regulator [Lactococcus plantarum]
MNIYDTMNQLERELRALPEYQAVVSALAAVKADETASALYAQFMDVQMKMQTGQALSEDEQKAAQELFASLQDNSVMAELLTKEQALQTITSDLQDIVFKPLQELYAQ